MSIGKTRAAAIIVATELVRHLKLGRYITEYSKDDTAGERYVLIRGHTDQSHEIDFLITVEFKHPWDGLQPYFQIEKAEIQSVAGFDTYFYVCEFDHLGDHAATFTKKGVVSFTKKGLVSNSPFK